MVIEAAKEDLQVKKEVFSALSEVCGADTIFATNSSSLSIDALAEVTNRPEKFLGLHFFNPVHRMDLVEVVIGTKTSDTTKKFALDFAQDLKKKPIIVKNSPGFIVNRLLLPQINEASVCWAMESHQKRTLTQQLNLDLIIPWVRSNLQTLSVLTHAFQSWKFCMLVSWMNISSQRLC